MLNVVKKVFGTENDRKLKKLRPIVSKINALEPQFVALSDEQLKAKTGEFKRRLTDGETLDDLMIEAFATVREPPNAPLVNAIMTYSLSAALRCIAAKSQKCAQAKGKHLSRPLQLI